MLQVINKDAATEIETSQQRRPDQDTTTVRQLILQLCYCWPAASICLIVLFSKIGKDSEKHLTLILFYLWYNFENEITTSVKKNIRHISNDRSKTKLVKMKK